MWRRGCAGDDALAQSDCGWWGVGASEELKCPDARMDATEPMRVKNEPFCGLTLF